MWDRTARGQRHAVLLQVLDSPSDFWSFSVLIGNRALRKTVELWQLKLATFSSTFYELSVRSHSRIYPYDITKIV